MALATTASSRGRLAATALAGAVLLMTTTALATSPSRGAAAGQARPIERGHGAVSRTHKPLVVVFGDSLITQARAQLATDLAVATIDQYSYPAQAACHYLGTLKGYLRSHRPRAAILEFWGNDNKNTPCINKYPVESTGYYRQYRQDVTTMVRELVKARSHVFIVGTIPDAVQVASKDPHWDELNDIYSAIADASPKVVTFVNVQQVLERSGAFTWYLPCLAAESVCDATIPGIVTPPPAGTNIVRSWEGLHFCPLYPTTGNSLYNFTHCATYASGTYRYAGFIARAVEHFFKKGSSPKYVGNPLPAPNLPEPGITGQVDPYTGAVYPQS